jgi:putative membrane protein
LVEQIPYCGSAPLPGTLLERFNADPLLACVLLLLALAQISWLQQRRQRLYAALGWCIAAAALMSPLCALSVALFSARITQHMILVLLAAPLIALGWPARVDGAGRGALWSAAIAFFAALWFWHMPLPYDATFSSSGVYWSMHITLFGSAVLLWRELLQQSAGHTVDVLAAGALTSMQMGLLGAVLALAGRPLFFWHLTTTAAWQLTPLQDQQLGGTIMWVPGIVLFLWAAMRSLQRLRCSLGGADAA